VHLLPRHVHPHAPDPHSRRRQGVIMCQILHV
jgi:hypothetical protein